MTAMSAAGSPRSAGRSTSTPYRAAGRGPTRRRSPPSMASSSRIPDGAVVLLDGLVASAAPDVLVPQARRLRLVVLVHMPLGHRPADDGADAPDAGTRGPLGRRCGRHDQRMESAPAAGALLVVRDRVHVAEPGVNAADLATGTAAGEALLCVAAVTSDKGHDVLLDALATITDLSWHCVCVAAWTATRRSSRVSVAAHWTTGSATACRSWDHGPAPISTGATPPRTCWCWRRAPRRTASSSSRLWPVGLPVVAADVGGLTEALGHGADGIRPGLLVPPDDPAALGAALRPWLGDAELRGRLRRAACERRESLPGGRPLRL